MKGCKAEGNMRIVVLESSEDEILLTMQVACAIANNAQKFF